MYFTTLKDASSPKLIGSTYDRGSWVTMYSDDDGRVLCHRMEWPAGLVAVAKRSCDPESKAEDALTECIERACTDSDAPSHFAVMDKRSFKQSAYTGKGLRGAPWWTPRYIDEGPVVGASAQSLLADIQ